MITLNEGRTQMKNAKLLRYAFCVTVLLGMGQQVSPMMGKRSLKKKRKREDELKRADKLKLAERRVVDAEQLVEQEEKKMNRKEKAMNRKEKKVKQSRENVEKSEKKMNRKGQLYSDAVDALDDALDLNLDSPAEMKELMKEKKVAKKKWNKAEKIYTRARGERKLVCGEYCYTQHECILAKALVKAKDERAQAIKAYRQVEQAY